MATTNKKDRKVKEKSQSKGLLIIVAFSLFVILIGVFLYVVYNRGHDVKEEEELDIKVENQLSQGVIPNDFPDSFPIYPGVVIKESWTEKDGEGAGIAIAFETSDGIGEVTRYYKKELVGSGWEVTLASENPESYTASIRRDSTVGFIGITKELNETVISVALSIK